MVAPLRTTSRPRLRLEASATLTGLNLPELCKECDESPPFVMASLDYCLKEYADVGYREKCTAFTACSTYTQVGYTSMLTSGPIRGKTPEEELKLSRVCIQFQAEATTVPNTILLTVGMSGTATDPNNPGCPIRWRELSTRSWRAPHRRQQRNMRRLEQPRSRKRRGR